MDEKTILQTDTAPPGESREVVLIYDSSAPKPVVLTYEAPLPRLPRSEEDEDWEELAYIDYLRRRRRRRGLTVFILSLLLLVITAAALWFFGEFLPNRADGGNAGQHHESAEKAPTTIPTYPFGDDFRLTISEQRGPSLTAQAVYGQVNPSVVAVVSYMESGGAGIGTGVIISADGYIVTNYHVVDEGESCDVLLSTGSPYEAKLVGYTEDNDIAVLKIEGSDLPAATFGSSDLLTVGDKAYAIGNPLGLDLRGTLTDGIISSISRDVDVDGVTMSLIQTNAALNSGNSGGPLINEYGQVVGINTIKMVSNYDDDSVEGLGFAIPSSAVVHIVNSIIATGEMRPEPVLGITVTGPVYLTLTDGSRRTGVMVQEVTKGLGGDLAGLRSGDIIVSADGEDVFSTNDLIRCRRRYLAGEELPMTVYRGGTFFDVAVPLMESE